ncbi:MAG: energy transducer TonB [Flavobacterium sp.]
MRLILVFVLFFGISNASFAQLGGAEDEVYLKGDYEAAKFNGGGIQKFHEFINRELDFSKMVKAGKVVFTFTIAETGEIKNLRIVEFPEIGMATEVIRVIKLAPKWEPAKRGTKPISINVRYPIVFSETKKEAFYVADTPKPNNVIAQGQSSNAVPAESAPEFPGGNNGLKAFIKDNFNYSNSLNLKGKVLASFVIDTEGNIVDVVVSEDLGYGTKEEALRMIKSMPKWKPGTQRGKSIKARYSLIINIGAKTN